ncbi:alpha/beta hydrolase [Aureimonas glaciei]|uniref:Membrane protein n=1 Tax=Aureimonas glaciei TaxID=1776957 RepID=A0A917D742_9HYPH|nr:alpha/beta-hydrolase family protein [Aureimonas glaciei]GGD05641.1 membrane protein [Aureimonas glaciei]
MVSLPRLNLSATGLAIGALLMAASLTPSLLPRDFVIQGLLSGTSLSIGYLIGVFLRWAWQFAQLPEGSERGRRTVRRGLVILCAALLGFVLWKESDWQNQVRSLMGMDPIDTSDPVKVALIAASLFALILALARVFRRTKRFLAGRLKRRTVPPRLSLLLGAIVAAGLFGAVLNGIVFEGLLRLADSSFQEIDQHLDADLVPPSAAERTGSPASLAAWQTLGARGREFVSSGPTGEDIGRFFGGSARDPLRVYVGLNSRETVDERAALALAELIRVGGFDRSVLVVVVPTGTGWIDPAALDTLEYLHRGDVASVAVQYSYLTSFLSLMVEPGYGAEAGRALFKAIYGHWTRLPPDARPRLYLHGLSLGAMNSMLSTDLYEVIGDPFDGALWSGPPFNSATWQDMTGARTPDSPAWRPRFRDGSVVRFGNQAGGFEDGAPWGPLRIAFLQYASDPVVFFELESLYREPDWMKEPRGPDVAPEFRWFPVVTMLQLAFDMAIGTTSPIGFGHLYAPEHYIPAWMAVTAPPDIDAATAERLKVWFKASR